MGFIGPNREIHLVNCGLDADPAKYFSRLDGTLQKYYVNTNTVCEKIVIVE